MLTQQDILMGYSAGCTTLVYWYDHKGTLELLDVIGDPHRRTKPAEILHK